MRLKLVWPHCRSVCKDPKVCSVSDSPLVLGRACVMVSFQNGSNVCSGVVEPVELVDNGDQTHTVNYVPSREGPYSINVLYADEEIPRR